MKSLCAVVNPSSFQVGRYSNLNNKEWLFIYDNIYALMESITNKVHVGPVPVKQALLGVGLAD